MLVTKKELKGVLDDISKFEVCGLDTETTGLRPYHDSRMFSCQIATPLEAYYFNFQDYDGARKQSVLGEAELGVLRDFFLLPRTWFIHNAKFDLAILARAGISLAGRIADTVVLSRVLFNDHISYSLEACAKRLGFEKSPAVEIHIQKNKLYTQKEVPGKSNRIKELHFDKVPLGIIQPYAELDARLTFAIGTHAFSEFKRLDEEAIKNGWVTVSPIVEEEIRLTNTLFRMEKIGVKIDPSFCKKAALFEANRQSEASLLFKTLAGQDFKDSALVFREVFQKESLVLTEKGNPSFTSEVLKTFTDPVAKIILEYRDAKNRANFYHTFLYESDSDGTIHANYKQAGTDTGRFSCSNPNLQNLTKEEGEDLKEEFVVRRAIVPREDYFFFMPDYSQMEYRLMLDYGGNDEVVDLINGGFDVHQAIADRTGLTRSKAKNGNFATLYGAGVKKLASMLECSEQEARSIRESIFRAAPGMQRFIRQAMQTAKTRGFVWNIYGRRYYFPDTTFVYQAPNKIIQGGCADIMKKAMNTIDQMLLDLKAKSRMVLNIHDEVVFEIHQDEIFICEKVIKIMEETYPARYLPMKVDAEYSFTSLADKVEGIPTERETRDYFSKKGCERAS